MKTKLSYLNVNRKVSRPAENENENVANEKKKAMRNGFFFFSSSLFKSIIESDVRFAIIIDGIDVRFGTKHFSVFLTGQAGHGRTHMRADTGTTAQIETHGDEQKTTMNAVMHK